MTKAILFDFDGVIMDSMGLKLDSYCYAFERFDFARADIKALFYRHTGLSRHKILILIYVELSGQLATDSIVNDVLSQFTEHDDRSRILMSPVPGSLDFLKQIYSRFYTAIITGTPQDVIDKTVEFHKLSTYFDEVRGSPQSKQEIIEELISQSKIPREQCIFIGDGRTDQEAAEACRIRFVGLDRGTVSFVHNRAWRVVSALTDLLPHLDTPVKP
ncbi:HAD family hydrolase [Planctomycetota bacterium]